MMFRWIGPVFFALVTFSGLLVPANQSQDFQPFYVAWQIYDGGQVSGVYAWSERSRGEADPTTHSQVAPELVADYVTHLESYFVSPPQALLLIQPFAQLPFESGLLVWRLMMAMVICGSIAVLTLHVPAVRFAEISWNIALISVCLCARHAIILGQNTPFMLAAATAMVALLNPEHKRAWWTSALPAFFWSVAICFKLFPILVTVPLLLMRGYRVVVWQLAFSLVFFLVTVAVVPSELFFRFLDTSSLMSQHVNPTWPNVSVDAGLARWYYEPAENPATFFRGWIRADLLFPGWVRASLLAIKFCVFLTACYLCLSRHALDHASRIALAWLAAFAVMPIVWFNYWMLLPVFLFVFFQSRLLGLGVALIAASGLLQAVTNGFQSEWIGGQYGSLIWTAIIVSTLAAAAMKSFYGSRTSAQPIET